MFPREFVQAAGRRTHQTALPAHRGPRPRLR